MSGLSEEAGSTVVDRREQAERRAQAGSGARTRLRFARDFSCVRILKIVRGRVDRGGRRSSCT